MQRVDSTSEDAANTVHYRASRWENWGQLLALFILALPCVIGCGPQERLIEPPPIEEDDTLERIGAAFKLYADADKGERFPPASLEPGVFRPDMTDFRAYFADSPEGNMLVDYVSGKPGIDICYLGFMVLNDEAGLALLDAYEALGPGKWRDGNIDLGDKEVPLNEYDLTSTIYRLRIGITRFIVSGMNDASLYLRAEGKVPVLWEMPAPPDVPGGWVLYMDGHKEWKEYPGDFPMTEAFISRLRTLMSNASTAPSQENTSRSFPKPALAASPVHEIATSVLEQLTPPQDIQRDDWTAFVLARAMRSWEGGLKAVTLCDEEPSVHVDGQSGYRVVLRRTAYKRSETKRNASGLVPRNARERSGSPYMFSPEYAHVELVLFPSPPSVSGKLRRRIPWYDFPNEDQVLAADMGEGHGYRWFGRMTVPQHFGIRQAMNLSGGDDLYTLAKEYLRQAEDEEAKATGYYLVGLSGGERAVPGLLKAVQREEKWPDLPVYALVLTQSAAVGDILLSLYDSEDEKVSSAAAMMLLHLRGPEAKRICLDMLGDPARWKSHYYMGAVADVVIELGLKETKEAWLNILTKRESDAPQASSASREYEKRMSLNAPGKVAAHFGWKEAVPLLEAHCLAPASLDFYRTAYELKRDVEGRSVPTMLREAERVIRDVLETVPRSQRSTPAQVADAKKSLLESPDKEAVALVVIDLATEESGFKTNLEPDVVSVAWEIARELPREAVAYHLRHIENLADRGLAELCEEFLAAPTRDGTTGHE